MGMNDAEELQPDYSAYQGYLTPWLYEIVQAYQAGMKPSQIADKIYLSVRGRYPNYYYCADTAQISYVLRRVGVMEPSQGMYAITAEKIARQERAWKLRVEEKLPLREVAGRIGVSIDRVRQMLHDFEQRGEAEARRIASERRAERLAVLLGLMAPPLPPRILGRPIDMGGPRDQWLERSPWDDI